MNKKLILDPAPKEDREYFQEFLEANHFRADMTMLIKNEIAFPNCVQVKSDVKRLIKDAEEHHNFMNLFSFCKKQNVLDNSILLIQDFEEFCISRTRKIVSVPRESHDSVTSTPPLQSSSANDGFLNSIPLSIQTTPPTSSDDDFDVYLYSSTSDQQPLDYGTFPFDVAPENFYG